MSRNTVPLVHFPMRCQACRRPLTVICLDIPYTDPVVWQCPYGDCNAQDSGYLCGQVLDVVIGWSDIDRRSLDS
jgi:hypothetical protein